VTRRWGLEEERRKRKGGRSLDPEERREVGDEPGWATMAKTMRDLDLLFLKSFLRQRSIPVLSSDEDLQHEDEWEW